MVRQRERTASKKRSPEDVARAMPNGSTVRDYETGRIKGFAVRRKNGTYDLFTPVGERFGATADFLSALDRLKG